MNDRIRLTLACWDYDRTEPLRNGSVRPDGTDLTYLSLPVEETFYRMLRHREFDVAEMSLSSYLLSLAADSSFVALPVFPSRMFRHNSIYVNSESGIAEPADLAGRIVGVPEYEVTAAVWIRGTLAEHHGVPVSSVRYRTGGIHQPGREEKLPLALPADVEVKPIPPDRTLVEMLVSGEIDALYTPRTPRPADADRGRVRRLFRDPRQAEEEYYRRTGVFPIMHTVVLRREVYERYPWVAGSLFKAFDAAKRQVESRIDELTALRYMLPWVYADVERTRALMGEDYWPYGLTGNEVTLRTFLRYAHEQGLTKRLFEPAELFATETLDFFKI
jgi:4,5-dihydroxyphthalate decarboxylase